MSGQVNPGPSCTGAGDDGAPAASELPPKIFLKRSTIDCAGAAGPNREQQSPATASIAAILPRRPAILVIVFIRTPGVSPPLRPPYSKLIPANPWRLALRPLQ